MSLETQKKNLLFIAILKVFHSLKFYRMRLISPKDVVVNRNFIRKKKNIYNFIILLLMLIHFWVEFGLQKFSTLRWLGCWAVIGIFLEKMKKIMLTRKQIPVQ